MSNESNTSGKIAEGFVPHVMKAYNFHVVPYRKNQGNGDLFDGNLLITGVPYTSVYGKTTCRSEFVITSAAACRTIRIECRHQETSGSVDEKFPYLYLNAIKQPENEIILLITGDGAHRKAVEWLRNAIKTGWCQTGVPKDIKVMNQNEFMAWAKNFAKGLR